MGTELVEQDVAEIGNPAFSKHLPDLRVLQRLKGGNLQLEQVVLIRIEINSVNSAWVCLQDVIKHVVACRRHTEYRIIVPDPE